MIGECAQGFRQRQPRVVVSSSHESPSVARMAYAIRLGLMFRMSKDILN